MDQRIQNIIGEIPYLSAFDPGSLQLTRLGGLTNEVYRLHGDSVDCCLRIPGAGTEQYIDRQVEKHNTLIAHYAQVSPKVHYFSDDGVMLTAYIPDSETMSPYRFQTDHSAAYLAGQSFRRLHDCDRPFEFRFEVFSMINEYLQVLSQGRPIELPEGYHDAVEQSREVQTALDRNPVKLAPCHCDPLCENFIKQGDKMWIVDWEYSGMNDPYWDLGDLSVEAGMSEDAEWAMLNGYFSRHPTDRDIGRMVLYKALCDLLWTLWGLIQFMNENPVEDFWAYSIERFSRCIELMSIDDFARHLRAV